MKKGFTLIEVLAVILLLGILMIVAIPAYMNILSDVRRDNYNAKINEIEIAANKYGKTIKDDVKASPTGCLNIKIEDLIKRGHIVSESDVKDVIYDPTTNAELQGDIKICYCLATYDIQSYYTTEFNEKLVYHKEDKVVYDNKIYRCIADYPGKGGINATYEKNGKNNKYFEEIDEC